MSTTVTAGATPTSTWVRRDPEPVRAQVDACLAEMHVQAIWLRGIARDLQPLQRKLIALNERLHDPALRAHPERPAALVQRDEWEWRERDLWRHRANSEARFRDACRIFNSAYSGLDDRSRQEVLASLRTLMVDAALLVRVCPRLRVLQAFREALPVWGIDARSGSPEPPF